MTFVFYLLFILTELVFSYRSETSSIAFVVSVVLSFKDLVLKVAAIIPSIGPILKFYMLAAAPIVYCFSYGDVYKNCYIFCYRLDILTF